MRRMWIAIVAMLIGISVLGILDLVGYRNEQRLRNESDRQHTRRCATAKQIIEYCSTLSTAIIFTTTDVAPVVARATIARAWGQQAEFCARTQDTPLTGHAREDFEQALELYATTGDRAAVTGALSIMNKNAHVIVEAEPYRLLEEEKCR